MENKRLTTDVDLPMRLEALNKDGKLDGIIYIAINGGYHDFKSDIATPKLQLVMDLEKHPELKEIAQDVRKGMYDE